MCPCLIFIPVFHLTFSPLPQLPRTLREKQIRAFAKILCKGGKIVQIHVAIRLAVGPSRIVVRIHLTRFATVVLVVGDVSYHVRDHNCIVAAATNAVGDRTLMRPFGIAVIISLDRDRLGCQPGRRREGQLNRITLTSGIHDQLSGIIDNVL